MWRRHVAALHRRLPSSGRFLTTVIANESWSWEFQNVEGLLIGSYSLPETLEQPQAIRNFFSPVSTHVRSLPAPALDSSRLEALRDATRVLALLEDLQRRAEELAAEERAMEAIVLMTSRWRLIGCDGMPVVELLADRSWRDRGPAIAAVAAGLLGPLAWLPGMLGINEVIMRRVDKYGGLSKSTPSGYDLAKATMKHHIVRAIYDVPRQVKLVDHYQVDEQASLEDIREAILAGEQGQFVTGKLGDDI
uniref:Uncharacterized protein n=1 Tax=Pfiesteria piscicida TaxID=71001 RepID=A3E3T2_PFIPI|nr:unknown [Pfiesteria piscicida]